MTAVGTTAGRVHLVDTDEVVTTVVAGRIHVAGPATLTLAGTALAGITVGGGARAHIPGHTEGLFVAAKGYAKLTGSCHGAVINRGGYLVIDGIVDGPVIGERGRTAVGPNATFVSSVIDTFHRPQPCSDPTTIHDQGAAMFGYHGKAELRPGAGRVAIPIVVTIDRLERADWNAIIDITNAPLAAWEGAHGEPAQVVMLEGPASGQTATGELRFGRDGMPSLRGRSKFV